VPPIDLPAEELAAVTAAIRRVIEGDRYPHAPRLDPLRAALARFDPASKPSSSSNLESGPTPLPKAPPPAKADKRTFLRQCIFIGTTNDRHPLKDPTGNRRFAPFWATEIDLAGLKADRDQLMAEAYQLYKSATSWWPVGDEEELFRAEQEDRFNEDAWTDPIVEFVNEVRRGVNEGNTYW
jgi:hypothetical protein